MSLIFGYDKADKGLSLSGMRNLMGKHLTQIDTTKLGQKYVSDIVINVLGLILILWKFDDNSKN